MNGIELFTDKGISELILKLVELEDKKQVDKWGIQTRTAFEWMCYLTEEVGELAQAIAEEHYRDGTLQQAAYEAVQVATLALKIATFYKKAEKERQIKRSEEARDERD